MAKEKKQRLGDYEDKLSVKGSFEDLVKVSVTNVDIKKAAVKKAAKKKG